MKMILNENDLVVGAEFENGTIQDYIDDAKTYGLVRIEDTTANWFLYNKIDSPEDIQKLYKKVTTGEHYIKDEFGEELVVFDKKGTVSNEDIIKIIDAYLDDEIMSGSF